MTFLIRSHYNKIQSESDQWRWKLQTMRSSARYEPLRAGMASYSSPYLLLQARSRQLIQFRVKKEERKEGNFKEISEQINSLMRRSLTDHPSLPPHSLWTRLLSEHKGTQKAFL